MPTDIDAAMNGKLCRCGTSLRIRQAIHRATALAAETATQAAREAAPGKR